ncbi:cytochrome c [Vibrio sp. Isolate30]|uniref:c-type cytochrome n=1 Tax=Vibrio sp. Isolate30 TaxID=2908536 RepID=UPI001EFED12C|nr:cytochrome c [Vibrio sp. Isolate30]MCG9633595.1 cytochrome c [Vibrio sp. Isolate30]
MPKFAILLLTSFIGFNIYAANLNIEAGEASYKSFCVSCHGDLGHGDGIAGKALPELPSNIYDGLNSWFEYEAELIDTVLNGNRYASLELRLKWEGCKRYLCLSRKDK